MSEQFPCAIGRINVYPWACQGDPAGCECVEAQPNSERVAVEAHGEDHRPVDKYGRPVKSGEACAICGRVNQ